MYVRVKTISGRRYIYLVRGTREKEKIVQKTLAYLGPIQTVALGIPVQTRIDVQRRIGGKIDWDKINSIIRKTPLTFDELNLSRASKLSDSLQFRNLRRKRRLSVARPFPKNIFQQRVKGELEALAKLSALGFDAAFEEIGVRRYRARM